MVNHEGPSRTYNLRKHPFFLPNNIVAKFERQFKACCKLMLTNLYYARAFFNPFMIDLTFLHKDSFAKQALNRVIRKMNVSLGLSTNEAMTEFMEFEKKIGPFHPSEAPDVKHIKLNPH